MTHERPGPHPEAGRQRRGHVVKRPAATAALLERRTLHAQPVASRRTFRVQTLYRPTGQIVHLFASQKVQAGSGKGSARHRSPPEQKRPKIGKTPRKTGGIVRHHLWWCQYKSIQLLGVLFLRGKIECGSPGGGTLGILGAGSAPAVFSRENGHGKRFNTEGAEKEQSARRRFGGVGQEFGGC